MINVSDSGDVGTYTNDYGGVANFYGPSLPMNNIGGAGSASYGPPIPPTVTVPSSPPAANGGNTDIMALGFMALIFIAVISIFK